MTVKVLRGEKTLSLTIDLWAWIELQVPNTSVAPRVVYPGKDLVTTIGSDHESTWRAILENNHTRRLARAV